MRSEGARERAQRASHPAQQPVLTRARCEARARVSTIPLESLVERLTGTHGRDERLTHLEVLPPREARTCPWPEWAHPAVVEAWQRVGVRLPWEHQAEAATLAHDGTH